MSMKRCTQCNELLPLVSFRKGRNQCKACQKACQRAYQNAYQKAYQKAYNKSDKGKACRKAYNKSDKGKACRNAYRESDKYKAFRKAYRQTDKYKAYKKAYSKAGVDNLSDKYVKQLLCERTFLHFADIPPELVAVKRLEIQLKRELRK